jgi:hypothetical protein
MDIAQLTGQVQTALQQRFDVNVAKVDDLIQKITSVPLVRDQDKKYLGDRLNGLLSMVDANSKVDMTNNNVTRQISNYISTAIDDNVKTQIGNSQKIQSFQQEAARIKKEKPELYNDANYAYAIDKSGLNSYMSGETDDLGSLQYTNYYDVAKNLNEPLEKWAKEMGFERVVDTSVEGGYMYQTVKGKKMTPEQIESYVNNRIQSDSNLKQQLMINSHYKYRGVTDDALIKDYQEKSQPILNRYDTTLTSIDSEIKNTNPDNKTKIEALNQKKVYVSQQKQFFESQLDPQNFNRDSFVFRNETQNLIESYKKTFGYSEITDIENDNFYKATKAGSTGTGAGVGGFAQGLPAGTAFMSSEEKVAEKEKESPLALFKKGRDTTYSQFTQAVKQQLQREGKTATDKDVLNYYANLKKISEEGVDINAQAFSPELLESYKKVEQYNKQAYHLSKVSEEVYGKDVNRIFDGLFGGKSKDLNIAGLEQTMPKTAELLKRYKNSSQVPARDRALAQYEIAKNVRDYVLEEDEDKQRMDFFIEGYKQKNKISDKEFAKYKPKDTDSGFSGLGTMLQGAGQALWNSTIAPGLSTLSNFTDATGEDYMQSVEEDEAGLDRGLNRLKTGAKQFWNAASRLFSQDTDLSEVESGDIRLNKYEAPQDIITTSKGILKTRFDGILKSNEANLDKTMSVVLSSGNKNDEPYIDVIKSALYSQGKSPEKGTNIMIKKVENGIATITFDNEVFIPKEKGGQTKEIVRDEVQVPVSNLPPNLMNSMQVGKTDWAYSKDNPQAMKTLFHYNPFLDLDSRYEFTNKYLNNYGNSVSPEIAASIQRTSFSEFKTKEELINLASKYLPREYLQDYSTNVLDSNYSVNWERKLGAFYPTLMKDGKNLMALQSQTIDYKTHDFNIASMSIINKYLEDQIMDRRKQLLQIQTR